MLNLLESQEEAVKLRKQFNNPEKNRIRDYLVNLAVKGVSLNFYEEPEDQYNILDLWGGGLFLSGHHGARHELGLVSLSGYGEGV